MATEFSNGIDLLQQRAQNVADGTAPNDAVTLQQLQALMKGLDVKDPVRAATTVNITLSGTQTIDGVSLVVGDRVLVKNQTTGADNGVYVVASGAWARASDANESAEVTAGFTVAVLEGTNKGGSVAVSNPLAWVLTNSGAITLGTTALTFAPLGGSGITYSAGNGLGLSGTTFSVTPKSGGGITVDSQGVSVDTSVVVRKFAQTVGDGSATSFVVTHSFGTLDVQVWGVKVSTGAQVILDVTARTTNSVTVVFGSAPASNAYRVVVNG